MDPSANASQHGTGQPYNMLDGIQPYSASDSLQNGEDLSRYFDPELFESTTIGNGFSQPSMSMSQDFDPSAARRSNTPDMYTVPQQNFGHHQFPQQQFYNSQQMSQATFSDPRMFAQPSPSPVSFDPRYTYQPQIAYAPQHFTPQQMSIPQRQTATPSQNYPLRQQQTSYVNIAQRPSQMSHPQNPDMMRFGSFQVQDQPHQQNRFVDPSMLTASQVMNSNGNNNTFQTQQSFLPASYFKSSGQLDSGVIQSLQQQPPVRGPQPVVNVPKLEQSTKQVPTKDATAAKKSKSRPKKDAASGATASESSDELEIEDDDPPELTPALLSVSMPTDERGKTLYRAVQAVWSPRNKPVDPEKVRGGMANYGDTIRGLRDAWRTKNESLRKAELPNSPTAGDAPGLKEEVARYRQLLEVVMARSLQYGHLAIVKRLGENQFTMAALSSFMLDRFNVSDFDSPLTHAILKFVVNFETLDSEMLDLVKLTKILQRLTKKATTEIKTLSQSVLDNATAAAAKKFSDKKSDKPASPRSIGSPADASRKDLAAGQKRLREGDAGAQPAAKKPTKVAASSKPMALRLEERRKAEEASKRTKVGEKAASISATTAAGPPAANAAAKAKVAVAAPQKSAIFAALSSVPKKPGTSNAERAAAAAKEKPIPVVAAPSAARPLQRESPPGNVAAAPIPKTTTSSSFLGVLLDMEKKPEKEVKKEVEIPNETEEEKAKRLRKDARRKLRVSWKDEDSLAEIRLFTHDPDEELDQGDRLKANAGGGREGEALKSHANMDDLEDEEDEDSFEDLEPYVALTEVEFYGIEDTSLGDDSPHITNSVKFGGAKKPQSRSAEAQAKYEQDTLMAIYTSKADRPASPKEPDDAQDEDDFEPAEPETPFGEPPETVRRREQEYQARQVRPTPQPSLDLNALAQSMAAPQRPQQQTTGMTPELQRALDRFNQPVPPVPTPQVAVAPTVDLQAILQSVLGQQKPSQPQQLQYPAASEATTYAPNINALLASIQQGAQVASSTNALPLGASGNPNPFPGTLDDPSRKHGRTDSNGNDEEYGRKGGNKKKKADAGKPYNYKTQICSFWQQGKCLKGDSCTYLHGDSDNR